jgi:hypothetical protein
VSVWAVTHTPRGVPDGERVWVWIEEVPPKTRAAEVMDTLQLWPAWQTRYAPRVGLGRLRVRKEGAHNWAAFVEEQSQLLDGHTRTATWGELVPPDRKITAALDGELHARARQHAADLGVSLNEGVRLALEAWVTS